jgi:hypothetical protein
VAHGEQHKKQSSLHLLQPRTVDTFSGLCSPIVVTHSLLLG